MTYNPTVNDQSGQILGASQVRSAEIKAAGNEALAQGIASGVTNFAGGITGAITKSRETTAKLEGVQATGQAMQAILPSYGKEGVALGAALQEQLGKAGNNPDKMAGAMMAFMPAMENLQKQQTVKKQYEALGAAYTQRAAVRGTSNPALSVEVADDIDIW